MVDSVDVPRPDAITSQLVDEEEHDTRSWAGWLMQVRCTQLGWLAHAGAPYVVPSSNRKTEANNQANNYNRKKYANNYNMKMYATSCNVKKVCK